ncbi:MAG: 4-hydroxybenzoate octaprenyltransferase [Rhodospirillales bacterium]
MLPAVIKPYFRLARFDRPIGTWLVLFPCWWSLALATNNWEPTPDVLGETLWLYLLFGIGAIVMRGAGCTFNDITDREFDAKVARTADRPIPSGAVSVPQALLFMTFLSLIGLTVLLQLNHFAILVGVASLFLVAIYPFMKRITNWPQFALGLTFNWGAFLGWAAVRGDLHLPAVILYVAGICWTLGYDTIYAHQDKEDDLIVGVKSSALKLRDKTRPWLFVFYTATVILIAETGYLVGLSWPFYVALVFSALQLFWQARDVDINDPADCLIKFKSNRLFCWILLTGIVLGQIL